MYILTDNNEKILMNEILIDLKVKLSDEGFIYEYNIIRRNEKISGKIILESKRDEETLERLLEQLKSSLCKKQYEN